MILVFSTNLNPNELVDDAFLRRIGYKIRFDALNAEQYHSIWQRRLRRERRSPTTRACASSRSKRCTRARERPCLPCHPRDLIGMAIDRVEYLEGESSLQPESLRWAWENYFVTDDAAGQV